MNMHGFSIVLAACVTATSMAGQLATGTETGAFTHVTSRAVASERNDCASSDPGIVFDGSGGGVFVLEHCSGDLTSSSSLADLATAGYVRDIKIRPSEVYVAAEVDGLLVYERTGYSQTASKTFPGEKAWAVDTFTFGGTLYIVVGTHTSSGSGKVYLIAHSSSTSLVTLGSFPLAGAVNDIAVSTMIPATGAQLTVFVATACGSPSSLWRFDFSLSPSISLVQYLTWSSNVPLLTSLALDRSRGRLYVGAYWHGIYAFNVLSGQLAQDTDAAWPLLIRDPSAPDDEKIAYFMGLALDLNGGTTDLEDPHLRLVAALGSAINNQTQYFGACQEPMPCDETSHPEWLTSAELDLEAWPNLNEEAHGVRIFRLDPTTSDPIDFYSSSYAKPYASSEFGTAVHHGRSAQDLRSFDVAVRYGPGVGEVRVDSACGHSGFQILKLDEQSTPNDYALEIEADWDDDPYQVPLYAMDEVFLLESPTGTSSSSQVTYVACEEGVAAFDSDDFVTMPIVDLPSYEAGGFALTMGGFPNLVDGGGLHSTGRLYGNQKGEFNVYDISVPLVPDYVGTPVLKAASSVEIRGEGLFAIEGLSNPVTPPSPANTPRWLYTFHYRDDTCLASSQQAASIAIWNLGTNGAPNDPGSIVEIAPVTGTGCARFYDPDQLRYGQGIVVYDPSTPTIHWIYITYGPNASVDHAGIRVLKVVRGSTGALTVTAEDLDTVATGLSGGFAPGHVEYDPVNERLLAAWSCGGVAWFDVSQRDDPSLGGFRSLPPHSVWQFLPGPTIAGESYGYISALNAGIIVVRLSDLGTTSPLDVYPTRFQVAGLARDVFSATPDYDIYATMTQGGVARISFTYP